MNTITIDPLLVSLIAGAVIPVLVALATKYNASSGLKSIVAVVASVAVGVLNEIVNQQGTFDWKTTATSALVTLVTAFSTYNGFWKPVAHVNDRALPNVGVGPRPLEIDPDAMIAASGDGNIQL